MMGHSKLWNWAGPEFRTPCRCLVEREKVFWIRHGLHSAFISRQPKHIISLSRPRIIVWICFIPLSTRLQLSFTKCPTRSFEQWSETHDDGDFVWDFQAFFLGSAKNTLIYSEHEWGCGAYKFPRRMRDLERRTLSEKKKIHSSQLHLNRNG